MRKKIISIVATLAVVGLFAGPANAATSSSPPPAGVPSHNVTTQCNMSPGIVTNAALVVYAVEGTADAWATNGSVGEKTALTCWIKDRRDGHLYASFSNVSDGPHAQVAGTVVLPPTSQPYACATASARFTDAVFVSSPGC